MTIIRGRQENNLTLEKFTEKINTNIRISADILKIFNHSTSFNYERKWQFKVEFYDKNE